MLKRSLLILLLSVACTPVYLQAKKKVDNPTPIHSCSRSLETRNVQKTFYQGYTFHIADYIDGTRVITCLDGPDVGFQEVSVNGMLQSNTRAEERYSDHFIHLYQHGRIITYRNMQIIELY